MDGEKGISSDQKRKQISRSGSSDDSEDENMNWLYKKSKVGEESFTTDDDDADDYDDYADDDANLKESSATGAGTSASTRSEINAKDQDEEISLQSEILREMIDYLKTNIAFKEAEIERCEQEERDLMYSCVGEQARIATDGFILGKYMDYLLHQFRLSDEVSNRRKALEHELKRLQFFLNYYKDMMIRAFFILILVSSIK